MCSGESDKSALLERGQPRSELRGVIALAVPVVITMSSRAMMDIADYVMITYLRDPEAQAALLPAELVMWSYIIVGLGIVSLISTFASQTLGRNRYRECGTYAWQVLYIAAFFGLLGLALKDGLPMVIRWINHDSGVQALEIAYLRVSVLTVGPTIAAGGLGWFFIGIHRPWTATWSVIEANAVNVVVSIVLIFGHLGFEPMGIAGAAWGTLVGVCYRAVRLSIALLAPSVDRTFHTRSTWRPSWTKLKELFRVGLPCGVQWLCEVVVWTIFVNVLIGTKFHTAHLVATNSAWQYMRIAFVPMMGLGQALTALVGKSIGAGNPERAIRETRYATLITVGYMGTLSVVYWLFGRELIALFNDDPEILDIGARVMMCAAVFQLFDALGISYSSALRGAGDTFVPSVFFIISHWVILVGGGYAVATLYPELGSVGPWMAASVLIAITGIFLWWRWHCRAWTKINLLDQTEPGTGDSVITGRPDADE